MNAILYIRKHLLEINQADLAEIVGVSQGTVSRWENGTLVPSQIEMAALRKELLRRKLEWSDGWFFDGAPSPSQARAAS